MKILNRKLNWTNTSGVVNIAICIGAIFLKYCIEYLRGANIYTYGNLLSLIMFYSGILFSIVNFLFLLINHKKVLKDNGLWIVISIIPFLSIPIIVVIKIFS